MIVNISQLRDHLWCPMYAHFKHTLRRGMARPSRALEVGTLAHQSFEAILKGTKLPTIPNEILATKEWQSLAILLGHWKPDPAWEIEHVEAPLKAPIIPGRQDCWLIGTPDALIRWNGKWWSLQFKTCSDRTNLEFLKERVRIGFHECAYQLLAMYHGFIPFAGTMLVTVRKLPWSRRVDGKLVEIPVHQRIEEGLSTTPLPRSLELLGQRLWDIERIIPQLGGHCIRNTDACFGRHWNSKCEYYDVCHGAMSIAKPPFVDLEDRYAEESDDVG